MIIEKTELLPHFYDEIVQLRKDKSKLI